MMQRRVWVIRYSVAVLLLIIAQLLHADFPGDSIYLLQSEWRTQDAEKIYLSDLAGKKLVLSMTYTSCQHTCPTIVSNMQAIENNLAETDRDNVRFVLVSLMPQSDTPEVLKTYANKRGLKGWTLLSGHEDDVRMLAMVLDIKYKAVANNEIAHSNLITILDDQGRIVRQINGAESNPSLMAGHLLHQN